MISNFACRACCNSSPSINYYQKSHQWHHMSETDRMNASWECVDAIKTIADGPEPSKSLHHDVGLILWASKVAAECFEMLFGITSEYYQTRKEATEKVLLN